jgi:tRNA(Arg) A34 adenosine deaminase TadA
MFDLWVFFYILHSFLSKRIMSIEDKKFMQRAIEISKYSVQNNGGPFGAVIVKNGEIIAEASNSVTQTNDPTAHAEVNAIRIAANKLKNYDLSGCAIYTSCEPCPMCLGAIYWAHIDKIYYANTKSDAAAIGFDDSFIYDEIALPFLLRKKQIVQLMRFEALEAFRLWDSKPDKKEY